MKAKIIEQCFLSIGFLGFLCLAADADTWNAFLISKYIGLVLMAIATIGYKAVNNG